MRVFGQDGRLTGAIAVLAIAQIIGWGTTGMLAVIGRDIADDLGMDMAAVFAGSTAFFIVMGLVSPLLARPLIRYGARRVMLAGTLVSAPAFALLSVVDGPVPYFLVWSVLGAAGAASLTTAAHVLVNELAGEKTRRSIGALMLATGLSNSLFWPISALVSAQLGWRGLCLFFVALILCVSAPIYAFALPKQPNSAPDTATTPANAVRPPPPRRVFMFMMGAIVLNAVVTFGLNALFIELLMAEGLPRAQAIGLSSMLGVLQIAARMLDFYGERRWDGVTTGLFAGVGMLASFALLTLGNGMPLVVGAFVIIYGFSAGALAIARATMPLVFYDKAGFAQTTMHIALPLNLLTAVSPPLFAALLTGAGSLALIATALAISGLAFICLMALARLRRHGLAEMAAIHSDTSGRSAF